MLAILAIALFAIGIILGVIGFTVLGTSLIALTVRAISESKPKKMADELNNDSEDL